MKVYFLCSRGKVMKILSVVMNPHSIKPWPNDRSMPTQHIAALLGATCWVRLATVLRCVSTCWALLAQIWPFFKLCGRGLLSKEILTINQRSVNCFACKFIKCSKLRSCSIGINWSLVGWLGFFVLYWGTTVFGWFGWPSFSTGLRTRFKWLKPSVGKNVLHSFLRFHSPTCVGR